MQAPTNTDMDEMARYYNAYYYNNGKVKAVLCLECAATLHSLNIQTRIVHTAQPDCRLCGKQISWINGEY